MTDLTINYIDIGYQYLIIGWSGSKGFGEYTLYKTESGWKGDSEFMDNESKHFLRELLEKFADGVEVTE